MNIAVPIPVDSIFSTPTPLVLLTANTLLIVSAYPFGDCNTSTFDIEEP